MAVVIVYTVLGALFMPFLAGTLLYMNCSAARIGTALRNRALATGLLATCLVLFVYLFFEKLLELLRGW